MTFTSGTQANQIMCLTLVDKIELSKYTIFRIITDFYMKQPSNSISAWWLAKNYDLKNFLMMHASPLNHSNLICAHGWNGEYRIFERNFNSCTRFQRMILHLLSLEITTTSYWTRTSALGKLPHLPKKEMFNFMRKWWCGFCIISNQEQIQRYRVIHGKVW